MPGRGRRAAEHRSQILVGGSLETDVGSMQALREISENRPGQSLRVSVSAGFHDASGGGGDALLAIDRWAFLGTDLTELFLVTDLADGWSGTGSDGALLLVVFLPGALLSLPLSPELPGARPTPTTHTI